METGELGLTHSRQKAAVSQNIKKKKEKKKKKGMKKEGMKTKNSMPEKKRQ